MYQLFSEIRPLFTCINGRESPPPPPKYMPIWCYHSEATIYAVNFQNALNQWEKIYVDQQTISLSDLMILKKTSPKGRSVRVTFELPLEQARHSACVVGSFNKWDTAEHPMERNDCRGVWTKSLSFKPGTHIEFRYFVDGHEWQNEPQADSQAPNPHYSENSVLTL